MSHSKRITKSADKVLDGCLGGISEHFGWDPIWIRLAYVIVTLCTGFPGIILYFILIFIMSEKI